VDTGAFNNVLDYTAILEIPLATYMENDDAVEKL